ncbi:C4-dicarboxylate ABC transporter [Rhodobacter veldkampii DSM 11550]|uniref:TRAP transporter large permease protein n=1 Tax=Phaeovulum veldkampii DSM 11550 TaxID=1185920 RepID=A0A2T4JJW5_9RHOB|nr:TRAP transporter large permease subunit [Phaeovulum veldkampii]MBK5946111.1 C4-dicarboxylate ABC transporter [Phaeovulum veldkampii DSM 11550]NCU19655.1 TRAP transporter large permease subunit [Candidatus Falkowbacteria bacterium]PTE18210.1 C4-dicarboxylate ABC transporter [Phaeovulum veldkampii DSM 11550]TDQ63489.1 C4-dicarboxylate transporter DctM subunit [Phaeovulum veldkampii DSM 11550]
MSGVIIFGLLIALLLTGMPIFAALGLSSLVVLWAMEGKVDATADAVFASLNSPLLAAIPMFAFMAHVMIRARVVDDLYDMANKLVGHVKGGLGFATILSCTIFATISGSSVATALTIGSTAIPQMQRFGYRPRDSYGVIAAGGTLGILIPPSGPMILYAIVSDASIGALFLAGLVPGLMLAAIFALFSWAQVTMQGDTQKQSWVGWAELRRALAKSFWAVMMPPVVLGGIYLGVFTATEAAAIGAVYALAVAVLVYRNVTLRDLWDCLWETMRTTAMLFMILAAAGIFGHAITIIRLPAEVMEAVTALRLGQTGFIMAVMAAIFVLGMFLETIAIILITTPIILPTMAALGIDPIWYGVMLMINLELALITPPVGMNLFVIKGITGARLSEIIHGALPYVLLLMGGLALIWAFPQLALWLPQASGFGR